MTSPRVPGVDLDACDLDAMEEKYTFMAEAHAAHVEGRAIPPRSTFRAIGQRFPGALKELERLSRDVLVARLDGVRAARLGGEIPAWLALVYAYHLTLAYCLARVAMRGRAHAGEVIGEIDPTPFDAELVRAVAAPRREKLEVIAVAFLARRSGRSAEAVASELGFVTGPVRT
jgi:hypothetical protein